MQGTWEEERGGEGWEDGERTVERMETHRIDWIVLENRISVYESCLLWYAATVDELHLLEHCPLWGVGREHGRQSTCGIVETMGWTSKEVGDTRNTRKEEIEKKSMHDMRKTN